jgi:hypothetical protein
MKLLIQTQDYENYAWVDGELQTGPDAYWKAKGGQEYVFEVDGFRFDEFTEKKTEMLVDAIRDKIEYSNDGFQTFIIGYEWVADDYMSQFEKSQLEYDGEIFYPAARFDYDNFLNGVVQQ